VNPDLNRHFIHGPVVLSESRSNMRILGIIPARYASTRFPGKPLALIGGQPMIRRVFEQASRASGLSAVVVATDDSRIADAVRGFGGDVVMTAVSHPSGTDRCAEALSVAGDGYEAVINIQGDEPFIRPEQIDQLCNLISAEGSQIATLARKIGAEDELSNPNLPKVVIGVDGRALYFSRQAIPYLKGVPVSDWYRHHLYFKHIGIYAYRSEVLKLITALPPGILEQAESLEQLRWLENGYSLHVGITDSETIAVDTPEDLVAACDFFNKVYGV